MWWTHHLASNIVNSWLILFNLLQHLQVLLGYFEASPKPDTISTRNGFISGLSSYSGCTAQNSLQADQLQGMNAVSWARALFRSPHCSSQGHFLFLESYSQWLSVAAVLGPGNFCPVWDPVVTLQSKLNTGLAKSLSDLYHTLMFSLPNPFLSFQSDRPATWSKGFCYLVLFFPPYLSIFHRLIFILTSTQSIQLMKELQRFFLKYRRELTY